MGKDSLAHQFETEFVPPPFPSTATSRWGDRVQAATAVLGDETAAQEFVDSIKSYQYMLLAHIGDRAIGLQLMDWDHHEMAVYTGRQALSGTLTDEEKEGLSEALEHAAKMRYEDVY